MKQEQISSTQQDLELAFRGESEANRKYLAFARKADRDGFPIVARLFRATAEAETIHALGHLSAMDAIKSTAENLKSAIAGETYENEEMYPPMLERALENGHKAKRMFGYAVEVERIHARLFELAAEAVAQGQDLKDLEVYLCPVCGDVELGRPDEACHVCGLPADRYELMA